MIRTLILSLVFVPLLSVCTLLSSMQVHADTTLKRKALLIGNYKYKKSDWRLKTPKKDIQALKKLLKKSGFQVTVKYNLKNKRALDDVVADFESGRMADEYYKMLYDYHRESVTSV